LGAPVGSVLIGDSDIIREARRFRKVMGGGMRQAGFLAAAGIYALEKQRDRLKEDNARARQIGAVLETMPYVADVRPVKTNILIFDVKEPWTAESFLAKLAEEGIQAVAFGPQTVRFVTHLNFTEEMMDKVLKVLKEI